LDPRSPSGIPRTPILIEEEDNDKEESNREVIKDQVVKRNAKASHKPQKSLPKSKLAFKEAEVGGNTENVCPAEPILVELESKNENINVKKKKPVLKDQNSDQTVVIWELRMFFKV